MFISLVSHPRDLKKCIFIQRPFCSRPVNIYLYLDVYDIDIPGFIQSVSYGLYIEINQYVYIYIYLIEKAIVMVIYNYSNIFTCSIIVSIIIFLFPCVSSTWMSLDYYGQGWITWPMTAMNIHGASAFVMNDGCYIWGTLIRGFMCGVCFLKYYFFLGCNIF